MSANPRNAAECGTESGYKRHRRNNEPACEPCQWASRQNTKFRHARRRKRRADARRRGGEQTHARAQARPEFDWDRAIASLRAYFTANGWDQ